MPELGECLLAMRVSPWLYFRSSLRTDLRRTALGLLAAALVHAGVACGSAGSATSDQGAESAALGRTLFVQKGCVACHGGNAEGGMGPRLAGTTLTLEEVQQQLRSPRGQMPAYPASRLSAEQVRSIYAYLKSEGGS